VHGCQKLPIRSGTGCFIAVPIHGNSGRQRVNTFNYGRGYVSDIWRHVIEPVKVIMQFLIATLLLTGFSPLSVAQCRTLQSAFRRPRSLDLSTISVLRPHQDTSLM